MKIRVVRVQKVVLAAAYVYLVLPPVLFFLGWCRWQIGVPMAAAAVCAVFFCLREQYVYGSPFLCPDREDTAFTIGFRHWGKLFVIAAAILAWTWLSGVGGYVWQNSDHPIRNGIFRLLLEETWPVAKEMDAAAGTRGLVYYLGFWLPAAAAGRLFGAQAGWAAQYVWAAAGILLMYALVCMYRKKLSVWPLALIICFSGLDAAGMLLRSPDKFQVFGTLSLDEWFGYYQFSSMTTQLFWVFNQAVPAWVLCALVFLGERPRNMVFLSSLVILTSTFPFAGLVPFVVYFMVIRCAWNTDASGDRGDALRLAGQCWKNWGSPQNLAGVAVAAVSFCYIAGNGAVQNSLGKLHAGRGILVVLMAAVLFAGIVRAAVRLPAGGWGRMFSKAAVFCSIGIAAVRSCQICGEMSPVRYFIYLVVFYVLEAGVLLIVLYPSVKDRRLFVLTGVWLFVIPLVLVGNSSDFCMRASIPGLFLMMLWCIRMLEKQRNAFTGLLVLLLLAGALTPLHEMKRSIVNTAGGFENQTAAEESVLMSNNFSGSLEGVFWRYLAGVQENR